MKSSSLLTCVVVFCVFPGVFSGIIGNLFGEVVTGSTTAKPTPSEDSFPKPLTALVDRIQTTREKIRTEAEKRVQALLNRPLSNDNGKPELESNTAKQEESSVMPDMNKDMESPIKPSNENKMLEGSEEKKDEKQIPDKLDGNGGNKEDSSDKNEMSDKSTTPKSPDDKNLDKILDEVFSDTQSSSTSEANHAKMDYDSISSSPKTEISEGTSSSSKPTQSSSEGNDKNSQGTPKNKEETATLGQDVEKNKKGPLETVLSGIIDVFNPKSKDKN